MLRRQARQRREFIYKKSLEAQERQSYENKQKLKRSLLENNEVPNELKNDINELNKDFRFDISQSDPSTSIDDEYSKAGTYDPKVLITTARDPSSRLTQFSKELRLTIPNSIRFNRGNYVINEITDACRANEVTDLIIVHETRGNPDALLLSHFPHGPTILFTLHNVQLRHDISNSLQSTVSEQYPHLIFENFSSNLGKRVMNALKFLFPVPKSDSKRAMTFYNDSDFISFRHHVFLKTSYKDVQLAEVGPRFELRPYEIKQGTIENKAADTEWVLRPYQRTASRRKNL